MRFLSDSGLRLVAGQTPVWSVGAAIYDWIETLRQASTPWTVIGYSTKLYTRLACEVRSIAARLLRRERLISKGSVDSRIYRVNRPPTKKTSFLPIRN